MVRLCPTKPHTPVLQLGAERKLSPHISDIRHISDISEMPQYLSSINITKDEMKDSVYQQREKEVGKAYQEEEARRSIEHFDKLCVMTPRLAAEYLSVSKSTIYRYIKSGQIKILKLPT